MKDVLAHPTHARPSTRCASRGALALEVHKVLVDALLDDLWTRTEALLSRLLVRLHL